jgi:site-specific DNA-methyltransferase (adenine-specific)
MIEAKLEWLPIEKLQPHPKNPRLVMRAEVVDGIAAQLKASGFRAEHAMLVRPVNGHYEILSGHHRRAAAEKAGVEKVPCWAREMGDEEAFMQLVLSNAQKELAPLEYGIHALEAVPLEKGGRGKKGGMSAYASAIGIDGSNLSKLRNAAEVAKTLVSIPEYIDKALQLAAVHAADPALWRLLSGRLLRSGWSVADTKKIVEAIAGFSVPDKWRWYLPLVDVVAMHLENDRFSPDRVTECAKAADSIMATCATAKENPEALKFAAAWWLVFAEGTWDPRKVDEMTQSIESELRKLSGGFRLGNWREHIHELEPDSVRLVLTDPPYGMDYQSGFRKEEHSKIQNDKEDAGKELSEALAALYPKLYADSHVLVFCHWSKEPEMRAVVAAAGLEIKGLLVWNKNNTGMGDLEGSFAPKHELIIHAIKGRPKLFTREPDVMDASRVDTKRHPTEKPVDLLRRLIECTTARGGMVVDPFAGVASTLVAAAETGRRYWGCELEAAYHVAGMERLS